MMRIWRVVRHPKLLFRKAMSWEEDVEDFVKERVKGYTLNVPCGESKIGDVRIDILPSVNPTKVADMNKIPYPNNTFDTVISDPPWNLNYYKRARPFFECVRVCKVGGIIIYNAKWIPTSKAVKLLEFYVRQSANFANISIISVFRKETDDFDDIGRKKKE